ncbi:vitamin K-dependent gamma-carboxylase-like isoform X1 [Dendronephthya gigantea]|uniref:vitamin K-dependent gamma-carboxylase-like isoform X1 n=1 Tax=Dendronephthya gigantea TaxID=151771 RepID=UPI0010692F4D|nr:vitamin K-dependent gamma-carboxylase-like isoform X1 [Dendronephthya gigantea]XP_028416529.1 vitamin K-dependent gamma-carboxylase-like isoform X1 [Dendronephthya gigantea]
MNIGFDFVYNRCMELNGGYTRKKKIFLVYFFAGVKKLDMDWISGYSMTGLSKKWVFDPFRMFASDEFIELFMVHICGLMFDLSEGFLLLFDKTRPVGLFFGSMFHLMNSQMFHIGMFPWAMLATMPFFLRCDWPRRLSRAMPACFVYFLPLQDDPKGDARFTTGKLQNRNAVAEQPADECEERYVYIRKTFLIGLASCYVAVQLFLPWSHFITQGYNAWTNGLYGYSWDMMVHSWSTQHIRVTVVDVETDMSHFLIPGVWIGGRSRRRSRWSSHPDMTKQYATCLARKLRDHAAINISNPAIYFDIWRSMNGRFQQRMFDPRVDIVKAPWSPFKKTEWVLPLMIDLSPWRTKLNEMEKEMSRKSNYTEVVFVADFPGLHLENFVKEDLNTSITVLEGKVIVEQGGHNVTLEKNGVHTVHSNDTHIVHTVSQVPSCWMYVYTNTTLANNVTLQDIENEHRMAFKRNASMWENLTVVEKFGYFMMNKMHIFGGSFKDSFYAVKNIVYGHEVNNDDIDDVGTNENEKDEGEL